MNNITENDSHEKKRDSIYNLHSKGGLFKALLFCFLIIAFIPVIIERYTFGSLYFLIPAIILPILSAYIVAKHFTAPIEILTKNVRQVASGRFDQLIDISTVNKMGDLAFIFNDMVLKLKNTVEDTEYQTWLSNGRSTLIDRMRGEQDISDLCSNIVTFISEYLKAQVGLIYMNENNSFRLCGTLPNTRGRVHSDEFKPGEGLVGQAALEKDIITLRDVHVRHLNVGSGLGEVAPKNIMVFPVIFDDGTVIAVIELGTINEFPDKAGDFLDHISKSIAIALHTARSRQTANELLEKALSQSAGLKQKQEKLTRKNEELEEQKIALEKQQEDMKKKNQALEDARRVIEDRANEIETASQYKSQFLANMSHELRTPLNSIILLSQLLSDNKEKNLTDKQVEYARSVQSSGYDLLNLINEILDLSKVESGKIDLTIETVPLIDITNAVERNFKPVVEEKNITFTVSIDGRLPKNVKSDKQRIEQILNNLLSNAFKFTSRGGIELRISRPDKKTDLSLSGLRHDQCISFTVSDTGIGIPDEKLEIIFEAFQQADGTTSRKYGGTGLGLSISRELAGILGGEIQAVSSVGKGSTFILYIPESLEFENDRNEDIKEGSDNKKFLFDVTTEEEHEKTDAIDFLEDDRNEITENDNSILIIDDDAKFAEVLRNFSRERGFKAVIAQNGEMGLHFTEVYKPSAIILDIKLPGINGWAVISRLKDNNETRHIPVYFVSSIDSSREALKMGAADFISKPVSEGSLEKLFKNIERFIAKSVKTLLVIEDNPVTKKIIEKLFKGTGVQIVNVQTGREAMEKLANAGFDCIILDLSLPDMSGFEILSQIKNNQSRFAFPIVVYTGKKLSAHERVILDEYTESIIVKGVNSPAKLLDEVSLYLHLEESKMPQEKRKMLHLIHDKESIFKGKKILLTDDDMRNVFVVTNILEQKGMKVIVAKNGREALSCLRNNFDIDLVIMDMMMPEMDGFTTIREIRKQKSFANLPIISLTAKAMKGDRAKCIECGASDYLSKPFEKERLFSILRAWLY